MPTIRSRCVKLSFRPLVLADFSEAVLASCASAQLDAPDAGALMTLHGLSGGSPGRSLDFIAGGLLSLAGTLDKIIDGLPRMDFALVHRLIQAGSGARNAETFLRLCDLIEGRIEDLARQCLAKSTGSGAAWAELWASLRQRRLELEALNLDKGAFLLSAFSDIERSRGSHPDFPARDALLKKNLMTE